jgi:hypothetical protein
MDLIDNVGWLGIVERVRGRVFSILLNINLIKRHTVVLLGKTSE